MESELVFLMLDIILSGSWKCKEAQNYYIFAGTGSEVLCRTVLACICRIKKDVGFAILS